MAVVVKNPVIVVKGGGTNLLPYRISNLGNYSVEDDEVTSIKDYAFYYDNQLTSISSDSVITIQISAFRNCSALTSINFPNVTSIQSSAFRDCSALTSINFPLVTSLTGGAFIGCSSLMIASFLLVTIIESNVFSNCVALTSINFPLATIIQSNAFQGCSALISVNFPSVTTIQGNAFYQCSSLQSITLGASSVCTLSGTISIPASSTQHLTIYVPYSLIDSYQTASNWSTHYNNGYITFSPISGTSATISTTVINGTHSGATSITAPNTTATVTLSANSGYNLPSSITVTNASYTYDSTTGVVSLSNIIGNVTISATCTAASTGYTLTVAYGGESFGGSDATIWIKTNSAPTSDSDRTVGANGSGLVDSGGFLTSSPKTYNDVTKVYVWASASSNSYVEIGGQQYSLYEGYADAIEITLSANTTIETYAEIED